VTSRIAWLLGISALLASTEVSAGPRETFLEEARTQAEARRPDIVRHVRAVATASARGEEAPSPPATLAGLRWRWGLFVTAMEGRSNRGCFGHSDPAPEALGEQLSEAADGAVTRDVRRQPLSERRLAKVRLVVTLVGPTRPIDTLEGVDPRREGVIVEGAERSAAFVPGELPGVRYDLAVLVKRAKLPKGAAYTLRAFEAVTITE